MSSSGSRADAFTETRRSSSPEATTLCFADAILSACVACVAGGISSYGSFVRSTGAAAAFGAGSTFAGTGRASGGGFD